MEKYILVHCLELYNLDFSYLASQFVESLVEMEINQLWCVKRQSTSCLTADELSQLITSFLESLADVRRFRYSVTLEQALQAMEQQMSVLKSLIVFAAHRSQDLLAHGEAVTINVAFIFFKCSVNGFVEKQFQGMLSDISTFLEMIRPQICETYSQALNSLKLSGRLLAAPTHQTDDDAYIAMKNILDYIILRLWELLQLNTSDMVSIKDHLQELFERLRSLRTILKNQTNNFDLKEDIGDVVCDAGVLIWSSSHSQTHIELDFGLLQELLATIKTILTKAGEADPRIPKFNFPMTNQLRFVDFVLEKLRELASSNPEAGVQTIEDGLVFLRSFLGDIVELRNEQEQVQSLWDRVLEVACEVECLIDQLLIGNLPNSFSTSFDSVVKHIEDIKADVVEIFPAERREIKVKKVSSNVRPSQRPPSITDEVVGFEDETRSIKDQLMGGSKKLQIVAIVGMPGLGKTTLATKVYNDSSVLCNFSVRAWCTVSLAVDQKRVWLELLNQIDSNRYSTQLADPTTTEHDVAQQLWRSLKKRKYLIFLDDIWSVEAWNSLQGSFPDDSLGSRIILTSRVHDVAPHKMMFDQKPHYLRQLNNEESLELLQRKLHLPPALRDLGLQIAENCRGLPLTIVIVAGLLQTREPEGWKEILDHLSMGGIVSGTEHCRTILELSYNHLPDNLRPCFLYFGAFKEDEEVSVRRLIRLWIAEGLVPTTEGKNLEDLAEDYLKILILTSLIMVAKPRWDGGVKACRIHDLLHDFCLQKSKDEHFFHILRGYDELSSFNQPHNLRRLCIYADSEHFRKSNLFCPRARSLLFSFPQERIWHKSLPDISFVIHIFKLLRVLDLEQIYLYSGFPREIQLLVQLAFLAVNGDIRDIPSSISKLSNLETLIMRSNSMISLPESLWNLKNLKYLHMRGFGNLAEIFFDDSLVLHMLDRLSGVLIGTEGSTERLMRRFPNIRRLKCGVLYNNANSEDLHNFVVPNFLIQLESLHIFGANLSTHPRTVELSLPENLKKLTLSEFKPLSWRNISIIGGLPNLEVLKLESGSLEEDTLEMQEGEFSKLRILKLCNLNVFKWKAYEDQFDCLQKLILDRCEYLEEMPCCLESSPTIEMIEVSYCSKSIENWVKQIEESQLDYGNTDLRITIQSRK